MFVDFLCRSRARRWTVLLVAIAATAIVPGTAGAALVTRSVPFTASDGATLQAYVGGQDDLRPRPLIVEFSPYAPACCGNDFGPGYNLVQVHARGTGQSTGTWTAVGPRDQQDVAEFLAWACRQPWSNGHIGLYGFSASAIAVYNSLHLPLACVDTAALMAGTADLYRDLLYPGGILNAAPGAAVGLAVGGLFMASEPGRLQAGQSPVTSLASGTGFLGTVLTIMAHTTEDAYWLGHTQRSGPNHFPILIDASFYDPEARGPFESFRMLRETNPGTHLITYGAHDGFPKGISPFPEYRRWFDHYLLGLDTGVDREPPVRLLLGNGGFQRLLAGDLTRVDSDRWPVPGTRWRALYLGARGLRAAAPTVRRTQAFGSVVSVPTATDPHTVSVAGSAPAALPLLTTMDLGEPGALTFTTAPLRRAIDVAGPAALDVFVATSTPESDLHAVIADVWPDGRAFPIGQGRLRTSFPGVDRARSLVDARGEIVEPYGDYSRRVPAVPGRTREYHVEFWPLGNHFAAGHRLRLYLVGTAATMLPGAPALQFVSVGGDTPSRLLVPVLPAG